MSDVLNRTRAEQVLAAAGIDAVVGTTFENVYYLTGYMGFAQRVMPSSQVYGVLRADALDAPTLVAPIGDLDMQAQFPARLGDVRPYGGPFYVELDGNRSRLDDEQARYGELAFADAAADATTALLDELGRLPASARIALDAGGMAAGVRDAVLARLGDRVVSGAEVLAAIRMVKTPEEIRRLERAALAIEGSYLAACEAAHEDMTEAEMASVFDRRTVEQGSVPHFTVIAFGERGALPNAVPGSRRLRRGDAIRFDIGCKTELYSSDIARTAVFGEPSEKAARYYAAILAGEDRMLELMRPGVRACDVFAAAVEATREAGIPHYRRNHVGHGIGLETYDLPLLNPGTETVLEPGMVFEIETPYYELGFGGLQVEDTVVVTADGCRVLTRTSREMSVLA